MIEEIKQKIEEKFNTYTSILNKMTLKKTRTTFEWIRMLLWIAPTVVWCICLFQILVPLGTLNFSVFTLFCWLILALSAPASCFVNWFLILLTTRRDDKKQDERVDLMWDELKIGLKQLAYIVGASLALPICLTAIPFLQFLRLHPTIKGVTPQMIDQLTGSPWVIRLLLVGVAIIAMFYLHSRFVRLILQFEPRIREWMANYEFHYRPLHQMLSGKSTKEIRQEDHYANMILGTSLENGDIVEQSVEARKRNSIVVGPIGAGKTSSWFRPQIDQDIDAYLEFIRDYPTVSREKDWNKPYGKQSMYTNGFTLIEPTDDLCKTAYQDCLAKGVPKDKIIYLNPENPNTPSLGLLSGPVDAAAQNLTDIFSGLKASNKDFFSIEERSYMANYVYLLKLTAVIENKSANFGELMDMMFDVYVTVKKRTELEAYVEILRVEVNKAKNKFDQTQDKDDKATYFNYKDTYDIAVETLKWFQTYIVAEQYKTGPKIQQTGKYKGYPVYVDTKDQFVGGLKSTLQDISKKIGLRRVLFRENSDFNVDDWFKNGGIIICNTAKKTLGGPLSSILGQMYSLTFQAATFRRTANLDPFRALYMDEFPDYQSAGFTDYCAQARKFGTGINLGAQSLSQLSQTFGQDYLKTLMSVLLTRATFGDLGPEDAKLLEPMFGEHDEAVESIQDQDIDLAADQSQNRSRMMTQVKKVPNITAAQIMKLEKYTMAIRTPGEHGTNIFDRIQVGRITDESVKNDPKNFHMDDPADKKAYETMIADAISSNQDYSDTDKHIIDLIRNKQYMIQWPTEQEFKSGGDVLPTILDSEGNVISGSDTSENDTESAKSKITFANDNRDSNSGHSKVTKTGFKGKKATGRPGTLGTDKNGPTLADMNLDPLESWSGAGSYATVGGKKHKLDEKQTEDENKVDALLSMEPEDKGNKNNDQNKLESDENTVGKVTKMSERSNNSDFNRTINGVNKVVAQQNKKFENSSSDDQPSLDASLKALDKSVHKSPNSGNGRNDNDLKYDDPLTASSVAHNSGSNSNNFKGANRSHTKQGKRTILSKPKASILSTKHKTRTKDEIIQRTDTKKEDNDMSENMNDFSNMSREEKHENDSQNAVISQLKHSALLDMQSGFNKILQDSQLTEPERLTKMLAFKEQQRNKLAAYFTPASLEKIIDRINVAIDKQQDKVANLHNSIDETDNVQTMSHKVKENQEANGLSDDLEKMLKDFQDRPITDDEPIDEAGEALKDSKLDTDVPFNDRDPFNSQPGMTSDNDNEDY